MAEVDLDFLARQMERLITENATFRDELRVQTAIIMRLDAGQSALLAEVRAMHAQISRMNGESRSLKMRSHRPDQGDL
jgi:hypothetical protein